MDHNILTPGSKFEVVEPNDDNIFGVGTTGFIYGKVSLDNVFMNLALVYGVIIRRGKGGKDRINSAKFHTPIFPVNNENFAKVMPNKGIRKPFLNIKPAEPIPINMMSVPDIDFMGWSVALVRHLRVMTEQCQHVKWPENKSHIFNKLRVADKYFEDSSEKMLAEFCSPERRVAFLDVIRPALSEMVRISLQFEKVRANAVATAAEFLQFVNSGEFMPKDTEDKEKKNEYRFTEDEKSLVENIKKCKIMVETVEKRIKAKQTKK